MEYLAYFGITLSIIIIAAIIASIIGLIIVIFRVKNAKCLFCGGLIMFTGSFDDKSHGWIPLIAGPIIFFIK